MSSTPTSSSERLVTVPAQLLNAADKARMEWIHSAADPRGMSLAILELKQTSRFQAESHARAGDLMALTSGIRNLLPSFGLISKQVHSDRLWEMASKLEALVEKAESKLTEAARPLTVQESAPQGVESALLELGRIMRELEARGLFVVAEDVRNARNAIRDAAPAPPQLSVHPQTLTFNEGGVADRVEGAVPEDMKPGDSVRSPDGCVWHYKAHEVNGSWMFYFRGILKGGGALYRPRPLPEPKESAAPEVIETYAASRTSIYDGPQVLVSLPEKTPAGQKCKVTVEFIDEWPAKDETAALSDVKEVR